MVNELELKKIWDKLGEKFSDQRKQFTYEYFKSNMQSEDGRKKFWNMFHDKINLGNYNTYEKNLTTDTLTSTTQLPSDSSTQPQKQVKTVDYVTRYPATQNPTKPFNSVPCDEKTYNWEYGCRNNKIGLMNTILFGDDYGKIYGPELMTKLRDLVYLGPKDTKITEDIYNKVLKLGEDQGRPNLQETIVKETVKNILKERLINN